MTKQNVDYSKTSMYKIVYGTETMYVGSTTKFAKRKYSHKHNCNDAKQKEHNYKIYKYMRDHERKDFFEKGGWDIIFIENFPCKDGIEKSAREFHYYTELKPPLNTNVPSRTTTQYYGQNEEYYEQKNTISNAKRVICICGEEMANTYHYIHKKTCEECL